MLPLAPARGEGRSAPGRGRLVMIQHGAPWLEDQAPDGVRGRASGLAAPLRVGPWVAGVQRHRGGRSPCFLEEAKTPADAPARPRGTLLLHCDYVVEAGSVDGTGTAPAVVFAECAFRFAALDRASLARCPRARLRSATYGASSEVFERFAIRLAFS